MTFIETIDEDAAEGQLAELYASAREARGSVPNLMRVFSLRPQVYAAWEELKSSIAGSMDLRRYELATLGAARALGSSYCCLAHGQILAERFLEPETVRALVADPRTAGLDDTELAVFELAGKVARDASSLTETDIQRLRDCGLDDGEILDVVAAAAARAFFSKMLDGLGALADPEFAELEPSLREALTVGRPIAEARA